MRANQTSKRNGIQDILCPFTNLYISQGSGYFDGTYSHQGTRAIDVNNGDETQAPYYAPFDCKAIEVNVDYGQALWYSKEKVRFADGTIDYCSFVTVHDNTINFGKDYEAKQGEQIGNMGTAGNATGVHCHIEFAKGHARWIQNQYGLWCWENSIEFEDACFMDDTNIISGVANWKYLKDVIVEDIDELKKNINELNEQIDTMQKSFIQDVEILEEQNRILQDEIVTKDKKILELKNDLIKLENGELQFSELCHFGKLYLCVRKDFK